MTAISRVEEHLAAAYQAARESGMWATVTFVTPSRLSSLQWRRRLARRAQGVFNVRFVDLPQLAEEEMARRGTPIRRVSDAGALAAAWTCLAEAGERFRPLAAHPAVPAQLLRAFEVFEALNPEEQAGVSPEFAELAASLSARLGEQLTATGALLRSIDALEPPRGRHIVLAADTGRPPATELLVKLFGSVPTIELESDATAEIQLAEVHDEQDEVALALALVQDWAVRDGIPPSEIAVVVPRADPYVKLLTLAAVSSAIEWNGLAARPVAESPPGRRLAVAPLEFHDWNAAIESWKEIAGDDGQTIRDELDAWSGIEAWAQQPNRVLLEALRDQMLRKTTRTGAFGDGCFVGTPAQTVGLAFRRMIVLGCTTGNYPRAPGAVPFLPPGVGTVSTDRQRRALHRLTLRAEAVSFVHARSDRRNGREAFPSPWLADFGPLDPLVLRSSQELLQRFGARSELQRRIVASIASGQVERKGIVLRDAWAGDVTGEATAGRDLFPAVPVSPSQLETFFDCPRKWFFRYVEKVPEPVERPPFGLSPVEMGTAVHNVLNALFALRRRELGDPAYAWTSEDQEFVREELKRQATLVDPRPDVRPATAELVRIGGQIGRMLERDSNYRRDRQAVPIRTEHRLRGRIAGVEIAGTADRIDLLGGDRLKVIDYKTGRGPAANRKDPTRGGTTLQGLIYAELARQEAGALGVGRVESAEGEYWFLGRPPQKMEETHVLNAEGSARLDELLLVAAEMMRAGLAPMRPTRPVDTLCEYCAYRRICPADREAIVARHSRTAEGPYLRFLQVTRQEPMDQEAAE